MKKIVRLTESDLMNIVQKVINEQGDSKLERRVHAATITKLKLQIYHNNGLKLYYFNPTEGKDFGLIEFVTPLDRAPWDDKSNRILFALTSDEHNKLTKLIKNVEELIGNLHEEIKLRKQQIFAVLNEVVTR